MGEGTFVRQPARPAAQPQRPLRLRIDVPLFLITITLLVFGLLMVYSASWDFAVSRHLAPNYFFTRQLIFAVAGLVLAFILSLIDYHRFQKRVVLMMGAVVFMLLFVLIFGEERYGSVRTFMNGSIQPSEAAKIAIIVYLAFWLDSKQDKLNNFSFGLIPMATILGITAGLIILQPDLSAAITVVLLGGLMFFLAGVEWKQIIFLLVVVVTLGTLVFTLYPKGQLRMQEYLAGLQNPAQASTHVQRTMEAVVRGGIFGVGLGKADTKYTGLPVPHTDSIYAVITEETGLVGASFTVLLYLLLLWRGLTIARKAPDHLGAILAAGATIWIVLEAIINMAVLVNLFPFAGNALPFISAGGSNMVSVLCAIGLVMGVARLSNEKELEEGRTFSAVVDLRRRDRRRSVPRSRRPGSSEG